MGTKARARHRRTEQYSALQFAPLPATWHAHAEGLPQLSFVTSFPASTWFGRRRAPMKSCRKSPYVSRLNLEAFHHALRCVFEAVWRVRQRPIYEKGGCARSAPPKHNSGGASDHPLRRLSDHPDIHLTLLVSIACPSKCLLEHSLSLSRRAARQSPTQTGCLILSRHHAWGK